MITVIRSRTILVLALAALLSVTLVLASCENPDRDRDHNRPAPGHDSGLWLDRPARLVLTPPPTGVTHRVLNGVYDVAGDSIMATTYLPAEQRTAALLAARVCGALCGQPGRGDVHDQARGGQRLIDGDAHNLIDDWPGILASTPRASMIAVLVGTDDLYGSPSADWEAAYLQLDAQARAAGVRPIPCLITPLVQAKKAFYLREPQREELNSWLRQMFAASGYVDTESVLATPGDIGLNPAYDSGDGMHLNAAGVAVLASAIYAKL